MGSSGDSRRSLSGFSTRGSFLQTFLNDFDSCGERERILAKPIIAETEGQNGHLHQMIKEIRDRES